MRSAAPLANVTPTMQRRATLALVIVLATSPEWATTDAGRLPDSGTISLLKIPLLLLAALLVAPRPFERVRPTTASQRLLAAYAAVALIGALAGPYPLPSLLRTVRVVVYLLLIWWSARLLTRQRFFVVLSTFASLIAVLAIVGLLTGRGNQFDGLMGGWIPPLHQNGLAAVAALGLVVTFNAWCRGIDTPRFAGALSLLLVGAMVLTGSRTAFACAVAALAVMVMHPALRRRGLPVLWLIAVVLGTNLLLHDPIHVLGTVERPGKSQVDTTFTGRSFAWERALHLHDDPMQVLVGEGQGLQTVDVNLRFTKLQTIDGAWPMAYAQSGILGTFLLAGALALLVSAAVRHRRTDPVFLGLVVYLGLSTLLESTINEITIPFVVFAFLCAFADEPPPGRDVVPEPGAAVPVGSTDAWAPR